MPWQFTPHAYLYFLAAGVTSLTSGLVWRQRQRRPGLLSLAVRLTAMALFRR
jgi:hypothetical protein